MANKEFERFVQVSTDEVCGEILDGCFEEDDPLEPRNPYAATKAGADLLARSYYVTYDLPIVVTRSSNNYGPRQHPEKLIPKFITRADAGESLPVYGDGSNVREWLYVQDNCEAIYAVFKDGEIGETYNIGSGEELANIELTKTILNLVGASKSLIEFVEDRPGHDQRYALDTTKSNPLAGNQIRRSKQASSGPFSTIWTESIRIERFRFNSGIIGILTRLSVGRRNTFAENSLEREYGNTALNSRPEREI